MVFPLVIGHSIHSPSLERLALRIAPIYWTLRGDGNRTPRIASDGGKTWSRQKGMTTAYRATP